MPSPALITRLSSTSNRANHGRSFQRSAHSDESSHGVAGFPKGSRPPLQSLSNQIKHRRNLSGTSTLNTGQHNALNLNKPPRYQRSKSETDFFTSASSINGTTIGGDENISRQEDESNLQVFRTRGYWPDDDDELSNLRTLRLAKPVLDEDDDEKEGPTWGKALADVGGVQQLNWKNCVLHIHRDMDE